MRPSSSILVLKVGMQGVSFFPWMEWRVRLQVGEMEFPAPFTPGKTRPNVGTLSSGKVPLTEAEIMKLPRMEEEYMCRA